MTGKICMFVQRFKKGMSQFSPIATSFTPVRHVRQLHESRRSALALFTPGDRAGRYHILRPLSLSHRHEIYVAEADGQLFALKSVSRDNPHRSGICVDMRRQFEFLASSRCPVAGVSRYEELLDLDGAPVVSMRYIEGQSLRQRI